MDATILEDWMIVTRAPLRLTLGGGGTDLPFYSSRYGGVVLGATINKYVYVAVRQRGFGEGTSAPHPADGLVAEDLTALSVSHLQAAGNVEVTSFADLPSGTGLGSSGSYLVALVAALRGMNGEEVSRGAVAEQAAHVEMVLGHRIVGKQDHFLAAVGGFNCLEISRRGRVRILPLRVSPQTSNQLRERFLLFFTGIRRNASDVLAETAKRSEHESSVVEHLHVTKQLGIASKACLESGDLIGFGHLLDEHWCAKKEISPMATNSHVDESYTLAKRAGALGGKIMGAGGGGFLALCCAAGSVDEVRSALRGRDLQDMSYSFEFGGVSRVA